MNFRNGSTVFRSFWQAGFECSTQTLRTGKRLDLVSSTDHELFCEEDYARLSQMGILTVREGLRWHLIEAQAGRYDFSSVLPFLEAAQRHGIQIIWDLCHFGWPDRLDVFGRAWIDSLAGLASAFGRLLRREMSEVAIVAPINEISFLSWGGGEVGYLNPFAVDRGNELKRQLVKGSIDATDALRAELPDLRLVAPEPVIHIVGDAGTEGHAAEAERLRVAMFEAWDMLSGRAEPELGGSEHHLDILGMNYYDRNQWRHEGTFITRHEPDYRPFREIMQEVYRRYRRPLFISETGTEDDDRPHRLAYIAEEVRAAQSKGVPIDGVCLYPILNHPGWDDDRHCHNGLWDYAAADGGREVYEPLAAELQRQIRLQREIYETPDMPIGPTRFDLPVPSALEFRLSTTPAFDEQIRP